MKNKLAVIERITSVEIAKMNEDRYEIAFSVNGMKYVTRESVDGVFHYSKGNSKLGPVLNVGYSIEYSCVHDCECFCLGDCYGCHGTFVFGRNQKLYTENVNFFFNASDSEFINTVNEAIREEKANRFRWFEVGDIINLRHLKLIIAIAKDNPAVKFWFYTKKYRIVNLYCEHYGLETIPENLTIIFSHWMNRDGSYYPMDNKYDFPTSEFIPFGKEEEIKVTHICPCSDPEFIGTCSTCEYPCHSLKHGESMGLLEHSTSRTKKRDKAIREAREAKKKSA